MEDALSVWPGRDADSRLARAVVQACLQVEGGVTSLTEGGMTIRNLQNSLIGNFLQLYFPGLLASTGLKLRQFLMMPSQSALFEVSTYGFGMVALDVHALHAAAAQLRAKANRFTTLPSSICSALTPTKVCNRLQT